MSYPKLLIHFGKHGNTYVTVNNWEEEQQGWLSLFLSIDQWCQFYTRFGMEADEKALYDMAKQGNSRAAYELLMMRDHHPYEQVDIEPVYTPDELIQQLKESKQ